jgi:uncharacterized protein YodC (DUF2158 family)
MTQGEPPGAAFGRGDRVQCTAGGPTMHVIAASPDLCYCNWVDAFGGLQQGTFDQRQLARAPPEAPPG